MKTRLSFVSNSSSCSFVVMVKENAMFRKRSYPKNFDPNADLRVLSENMEQLLLKKGFHYCKHHSPLYIEWGENWKSDEPTDFLAYSDVCNAQFPIALMVQNDIPFEGVDHYGTESVFFEKGGECVTRIRNPGIDHTIYHHCVDPVQGDVVTTETVESYHDEPTCIEDMDETDYAERYQEEY